MTSTDRRPVLLYDGHCRFCVAQSRRLAGWLGGRVDLESFREPTVLARYPQVSPEACEGGMQLVLPDGRVVGGAEAVARALRLAPLTAPLGWLYAVPGLRWLADVAYRLIADNRLRLGGAVCDDTCRLHPRS